MIGARHQKYNIWVRDIMEQMIGAHPQKYNMGSTSVVSRPMFFHRFGSELNNHWRYCLTWFWRAIYSICSINSSNFDLGLALEPPQIFASMCLIPIWANFPQSLTFLCLPWYQLICSSFASKSMPHVYSMSHNRDRYRGCFHFRWSTSPQRVGSKMGHIREIHWDLFWVYISMYMKWIRITTPSTLPRL